MILGGPSGSPFFNASVRIRGGILISYAMQNKLSFGTKVLFGSGAVGEAVFLGLFNTFIQIFYNQAIGLSNTLIGAAIMLAMIGDAITDPAVGMISDRWRSKHGRRHPFLFIAPVPLALSLWMIFHPPAFLFGPEQTPNQLGMFAWLAVMTIISRAFLTLYSVPHVALGGELSKDQHQRSQLFSANSVIAYASGASFAFVAWSVFLAGDRVRASDGATVPGQLDPAAYSPMILMACGLILVSIWICAAGTYRHVGRLSAPEETSKLTLVKALREILGTLHNKNYAILLLGFFFFMLTSGIFDTLQVHIATYYWELPGSDYRWLAIVIAPTAILGALIAPPLMRRFDRKPVLLVALAAVVVFAQLDVDLRLLGVLPENGDPDLLPYLLANRSCFGIAIGLGSVTIMSMIGDIVDDNEVKTGLRQEGLFYSARAFFAKASYSVGHFVAGIILDVFVRLPTGAIPGELDGGLLVRMGITAGPVMAVSATISWFIYRRYNLSRSDHAKIISELEQRAATKAEKLAE